MSLVALTQSLGAGHDLTAEQMSQAVGQIMAGQSAADEVADFLLALKRKGETATEIAGAARAVRAHMTRVQSSHTDLLDTCGTGGDGSATFNISTAAALVAAATGAHVAKHGNRSVSSKSGSADVLRELGVNVEASLAQVQRCLEEIGICFCFAPVMHPAMKSVAEVRRQLGVPTVFNLLGPLCNPANTPYQLLGVGRPELLPVMAAVISQLGCRRSVVISASDGLDEVSIAAPTNVRIVTSTGIENAVWTPADFGVASGNLDQLVVAGPEQSADCIRGVLAGRPGPARDIVVINAAAAVWTVGLEPTLKDAASRAAAAIDRGHAATVLARLCETSQA